MTPRPAINSQRNTATSSQRNMKKLPVRTPDGRSDALPKSRVTDDEEARMEDFYKTIGHTNTPEYGSGTSSTKPAAKKPRGYTD